MQKDDNVVCKQNGRKVMCEVMVQGVKTTLAPADSTCSNRHFYRHRSIWSIWSSRSVLFVCVVDYNSPNRRFVCVGKIIQFMCRLLVCVCSVWVMCVCVCVCVCNHLNCICLCGVDTNRTSLVWSLRSQPGWILGVSWWCRQWVRVCWCYWRAGWIVLAIEQNVGILECWHGECVGNVLHLLIIEMVPFGIVLAISRIVSTTWRVSMMTYASIQFILFRIDRQRWVHIDITGQFVSVVWKLFQI